MPGRGPEVHPARFQSIRAQRLPEHRHVGVLLGEAVRARRPAPAGVRGLVDAEPRVADAAHVASLLGHHPAAVRVARVQPHDVAEAARQPARALAGARRTVRDPARPGRHAGDLGPAPPRVVRAVDGVVALQVEPLGAGWVLAQAVRVVAGRRLGVGQVVGPHAAVHRLPALAPILAPVAAARRDGDEQPLGVAGVHLDRVEEETAARRLPRCAGGVVLQRAHPAPARPLVVAPEERRRFDPRPQPAGPGGVPGRQVPDPLELAVGLRREGEAPGGGRPALPAVLAPVDVAAPYGVVDGRPDPAGLPRIGHGVVHLVAFQQRALQPPRLAIGSGEGAEETLPGAHEENHVGDLHLSPPAAPRRPPRRPPPRRSPPARSAGRRPRPWSAASPSPGGR